MVSTAKPGHQVALLVGVPLGALAAAGFPDCLCPQADARLARRCPGYLELFGADRAVFAAVPEPVNPDLVRSVGAHDRKRGARTGELCADGCDDRVVHRKGWSWWLT